MSDLHSCIRFTVVASIEKNPAVLILSLKKVFETPEMVLNVLSKQGL